MHLPFGPEKCASIRNGKPSTPFLTFGDRARIEMLGNDGQSIFDAIEQEVVRYQPK